MKTSKIHTYWTFFRESYFKSAFCVEVMELQNLGAVNILQVNKYMQKTANHIPHNQTE